MEGRRKHRNYFESKYFYTCATCHCHLVEQQAIISKTFQGRNGTAYLVNKVLNVTVGAKEERMLLTGMHTVADILCNQCHVKIGWKYEKAPLENAQKYKEGKYIVEKARITKDYEIE